MGLYRLLQGYLYHFIYLLSYKKKPEYYCVLRVKLLLFILLDFTDSDYVIGPI
jgi:hypothetical protein